MLSELINTPGWQAILKLLSDSVRAPVFVRDLKNETVAVMGKVPFFQELLNRSGREFNDGVAFESGFAMIAVPIILDKRVGTLLLAPFRVDEKCDLEEEFQDAFTELPKHSEDEVKSAALLASFIAKALPSLGKEELAQAKKIAQALLAVKFIQETAQYRTLERLLNSAAQFFVHKFRLNNCTLSAYGVKFRYFSGRSDEAYSSIESILESHLRTTKVPCFISNAKQDFLLKNLEKVKLLPQTITAYPLIVGKVVIGSIFFYSDKAENPCEDLSELAGLLLRQVLQVVQYQAVQKSALTDNLTGLFNRVFIEETLGNTLAKLSQEKKPVTFMMFDIDNFKEYNDTHGHPGGDDVIKQIANITLEKMPSDALCCRYGGEEFLVVLPNIAADAGKSFAEGLREGVQARSPLTVSIGIITCLNSSASPTTLIREADRALYQAKNSGKNRVVSFLMVDKNLGIIDVEKV
jgi:diguanylate cyclase (GGDEF)-like protein